MVDLIVKCTHLPTTKVGGKEWMLFVDGVSNAKGSRVGGVLISAKKEVLEYSLRFTFSSSNSVVEYEALLVGMKLAKKLEVKSLVAHNDS